MPNAGFETGKILKTEIKNFARLYPNIDVRLTIVPWSHMWERLWGVFKGKQDKNKPDIIQLGSTWISSLVHMNGLVDLRELVKNSEKYDFVPQLWQSCRYEGDSAAVFALPWFADIRILYYRKDIFNKLKLTEDMLGDWKSFKDVLKKIKNQKKIKIYPMSVSGQKESILIHDLLPWILSAGGKILFSESGKLKLLNEKARKGIKYYFDLLNKRYIVLKSEVSPVYTGDFFSGNFALQISGVWPLKSCFNPEHSSFNEEVTENFGVVLLPEGPGGRFTYIGGSSLAVTKFCSNPEAAAKFVEYLVSTESQVRVSSSFGMLPAKTGDIDIFFSDDRMRIKNVYKKSISIGRDLPSIIALGTLEQLFTEYTSNILSKIKNRSYSTESLLKELDLLEEKAEMVLTYIMGTSGEF